MKIDYSKLPGKIWYNGKFIQNKNAMTHVLNHSLHFASAVFEGIRVYNQNIFYLDDHIERFFKSAKILDYRIPFKSQKIKSICKELTKINKLKSGYLRPIAWRDCKSMAPTNQNSKINVAIGGWEWPVYYSSHAKYKGISLCFANWKRPPINTSPGDSKCSGNYQINTLSKHYAERKGFDDALMLDIKNNICETTSSNIFFIKKKIFYTPKINNFLNGITRKITIKLLKRRKITVKEVKIKKTDVYKFDSCFITGTACEITPVCYIERKKYDVNNQKLLNLIKDFNELTNKV